MGDQTIAVYKGEYITVTEEPINGHVYERVYFRDGVCVIPAKDGKVLLINEYRVHERQAKWKLVSGWMDKSERTPLEVAQEEMAEEVGMESDQWELFYDSGRTHSTINTHTMYFIAHDPQKMECPPENPDDDAIVETKWVDEQALNQMIDRREIAWNRDVLCVQRILSNYHESRLS